MPGLELLMTFRQLIVPPPKLAPSTAVVVGAQLPAWSETTQLSRRSLPPSPVPSPSRCAAPYPLQLFLRSPVAIAAVFTVVTTVSTTSFTAQVESNVKSSLGTALQGAMKYITDPLLKSVSYVTQLKQMIELRPEAYGCDDSVTTFPGSTGTVGFYFEAGMYALQHPTLFNVFQSRTSHRYFEPNSTPLGISCTVSISRNLLQLFVNNTRSLEKYTNGSYFDTLGSVPRNVSVNFQNVNELALMRAAFSTNTSKWLSDSIAQGISGLAGPANKYSYVAAVNYTEGSSDVWVVGIDHNLADLQSTLLAATPPITVGQDTVPSQVSGAHTTMYDLNDMLVMASTHADVPVAPSYGEMYKAGKTPSSAVNDAFNRAISICGDSGCTEAVVHIDSHTVHTAYRIIISDAKLHLMMVSSVPRSFFFADADRSFAVSVGLSVGCCVLIIGACVALLALIHRPLNTLKDNMMLAAELHNDRVNHTSTYLRDIADLSAVFDGMNQQLLIARSFVPEAVLLGKTDDSHDITDDEGAAHVTSSCRETAASKPPSSSSRAAHGVIIEGTNNTSTSNNSSNGMSKLFNIAEKRVGVLSLNLIGFHALCAPERHLTRTHKITDISTTLLAAAVACSHQERGVMDSFHGDHFTLTFNASRAVAGPLAAAVRTANAFIRNVSVMYTPTTRH